MTPEMIQVKGSRASPLMDVWAIGIMMYIMMFYKFPFNGGTREEIKASIINDPLKIPRDLPITDEATNFLKGCLQKDPNKRMNVSDLLQSEWLLLSDDKIEEKIEIAV